jgi:hypothetical protein
MRSVGTDMPARLRWIISTRVFSYRSRAPFTSRGGRWTGVGALPGSAESTCDLLSLAEPSTWPVQTVNGSQLGGGKMKRMLEAIA